MNRRPSGDRGAAALELALVLVVVLALLALVAPLPFALAQKSKLEQAASRTIRWATSTPSGIRPDAGLVAQEGRRAFFAAGGRIDTGFTAVLDAPQDAPQCPRRKSLTVTLTNDVDLGPFGAMLRSAGITPPGLLPLTARATSCQE